MSSILPSTPIEKKRKTRYDDADELDDDYDVNDGSNNNNVSNNNNDT